METDHEEAHHHCGPGRIDRRRVVRVCGRPAGDQCRTGQRAELAGRDQRGLRFGPGARPRSSPCGQPERRLPAAGALKTAMTCIWRLMWKWPAQEPAIFSSHHARGVRFRTPAAPARAYLPIIEIASNRRAVEAETSTEMNR